MRVIRLLDVFFALLFAFRFRYGVGVSKDGDERSFVCTIGRKANKGRMS